MKPCTKILPRPGGTVGSGKRDTRGRKDKAWLAAVGSIESCVLCGAWGIQVAHRNQGRGVGQKAPDVLTAALCFACHHEIDNGNYLTKDERRARMDRAIVLTLAALWNLGLIGVNVL